MKTKILAILCAGALGAVVQGGEVVMKQAATTNHTAALQTAMFGAGCFWCTEAVFQRTPGVKKTTPGYAGGHVKNPTYQQVCTGDTGHAEVTRIEYDPSQVTYEALLKVFWEEHDPTSLNRQGADSGTQYRSAIFYFTPEQKAAAEASKAALEKSGAYKRPIVTEIVPAGEFYAAEDYHQNYYNDNKNAPYCRLVIQPKLKKLGVGE